MDKNLINRTVFISGHIDLTEEEFAKWYLPEIEKLLRSSDKMWFFIVGDANGADKLAQDFLSKSLQKADHDRVTVYHIGKKPKNQISPGFCLQNFSTHDEKDAYATLHSCLDIAFVRPPEIQKKILEDRGIKYDPNRKSGTEKNLERRKNIL